jgi:phospholipid/cholesterol/gamma-HCH transport system substrate-binding protein
MRLTPRLRSIISGLCALVLLASFTTIGIKYAFGFYDDGYELVADFDTAGQGLLPDSNVKMRGVNIGHVQSIRLNDGRARVTLFINDGVDVPTSTVAVIRPKTLFGEKFVDLMPGRLEGTDDDADLYEGGDAVTACQPGDLADALPVVPEGQAGCTVSSVELEEVLAAAYPILEAIDPNDLQTIIGELATAADGMGETINRSIVNGAALLEVQAANDANTRRFLEALAQLSGELADRSDDLIAGARDLNVALPVLTGNADRFEGLLIELERLSNDASDLLEDNTAFIDAVYTDGQATLDTLFENRSQLIPLVIGLRQFTETIGSTSRIPLPDGTLMTAVKGLLGGEVCGILPCIGGGTGTAATTDTGAAAPAGPTTAPTPGPSIPLLSDLLGILDGHVSTGTEAVLDLLLGNLFGGAG